MRRFICLSGVLALAVATTACEPSATAVNAEAGAIVVLGHVSSLASPAGIEVSTAGYGATDVTDAHGHFRVTTARASQGLLRFKRGSLDAEVRFDAAQDGIVAVEVVLEGSEVTLVTASAGRRVEYEGVVNQVVVSGTEPSRVLRATVVSSSGSETVEINEETTVFDDEGDLLTFADLAAALDRGDAIEIEGYGDRQDDGVIQATSVKAETEDDDDHDDDRDDDSDDEDFEGLASLTSVSGDEPTRTLRVSVADTAGALTVDIVEETTVFDGEGDLLTFADLLAALDRGDAVEIEGYGELQDDGSFVATSVKAETEDDDDHDDDHDDDSDDEDFEGLASLTSVSGDEPTRTLRVSVADTAGAVTVDIVEETTVFDGEGDLLTFADLLAALDRGDAVEIEGYGELQDDGSFVATSVKAETED